MLNKEEELKIQELKDKCRELSVPPPPDIFIGLQVHDKNGILVFDDVQRGHSFTRNYYNLMFGMMSGARGSNTSNFGAGHMSGRAIGGTIYGYYNYLTSSSSYSGGGFTNTGNNISSGGIVVGSDNTAFDKKQYALVSVIAHGNGTGQLAYQPMSEFSTANIPIYTAGTKTWQQQHARVMNNNSGASITVKEVGMYWFGGIYHASSSQCYMVERSVLDPTVAVANGAQLTVTYTISMDYSSID